MEPIVSVDGDGRPLSSAEVWLRKDYLVAQIWKAREVIPKRSYNSVWDKLAKNSPTGNIENNTNESLEDALKNLREKWKKIKGGSDGP